MSSLVPVCRNVSQRYLSLIAPSDVGDMACRLCIVLRLFILTSVIIYVASEHKTSREKGTLLSAGQQTLMKMLLTLTRDENQFSDA